MPLLPRSTNELAHLKSCLSPPLHAYIMELKQDPDVDTPLRKCKVMLIPHSCQKTVL